MLPGLPLCRHYHCQDESRLVEFPDDAETVPLVLEVGLSLPEVNEEIVEEGLMGLEDDLVVANDPQQGQERRIDGLEFSHCVLVKQVHILSKKTVTER